MLPKAGLPHPALHRGLKGCTAGSAPWGRVDSLPKQDRDCLLPTPTQRGRIPPSHFQGEGTAAAWRGGRRGGPCSGQFGALPRRAEPSEGRGLTCRSLRLSQVRDLDHPWLLLANVRGRLRAKHVVGGSE